jgi:hypothetical protein
MSFWRLFLILPAGALAWAFTSFPVTGNASSSQAAQSETTQRTTADVAAVRLIDSARARLEATRSQWLRTTLWEAATLPGVNYVAEGRYLSGPDGQLRLELTTRCGSKQGNMRIVSDGCRTMKVVTGDDNVRTETRFVDAEPIVNRSKGRFNREEVRRNFLEGRSCKGPREQLDQAAAQLTWVEKEKVRREGKVYYRLTGLCKPSPTEPPMEDDPELRVAIRQCRLYLDENTLWPSRIEWWGSASADVPLSLLFQYEYRNPLIDKALPASKVEDEFRVDPKAERCEDQTERLSRHLLGAN